MPTTTRFGLRSPNPNDAPNAPQDIGFLASDTDAWLSRAFPCTSVTRPTGVPDGFLIRETDTGNVMIYTGSTWVQVNGSGGGGGGGGSPYAGVGGQWSAPTAQEIPFNVNTVVAFGTVNLASAVVARSTEGAGHKFTVSEAGTYAVDATVRFAAGDAGGNRYIDLRSANNVNRYQAVGNDGGPGAVTLGLSVVRKLAASATLCVVAAQAQTGGDDLALVPTSGAAPTGGWVQISITKIAA